MFGFLDFLAAYFGHLSDERRAASAAQAQQSPAQSFAAAWNAGRLQLPSAFIYDVQDPVSGATATAFPWCDAALDSDGQLRLALTVPPDAPIDATAMAEHVEEVRQLARGFFQVGLRLMESHPYRQTLQMALAPVCPQVAPSGEILLGYDDTGSPVATRFIGEVTAISGVDWLCLPWVAASYAAIERRTLDWQTAIASTGAAARQAQTGASVPYALIDVGDAVCEKNTRPETLKNLASAHRGIVEWSRGDVSPAAWAIRPTQILRRDGSAYVLERDGRQLRFLPAWLY